MANRFDKIRVIGSGSFGQAWLVCSKQSRRQYVVKEMQVSSMTEKERNQAMNEVSILARLKHQHVIRYRQAYVEQGLLCIAMEYADGGDLAAIIYKTAELKLLLDEQRIINWFVQICLALEYIHSLNILHRDLKPQNIFVTSNDRVKIGDFGIARILSDAKEHANTAIGTPYYLSPEICCRKSYNQKSDMWAAGCILYELATLKHPFDATNFSLLVVKILSSKYKPLNPVYGPFLNDLISVLLSVNPNSRPSAEQVLQIPFIQQYLDKDLPGSISLVQNLNENLNDISTTQSRQTVLPCKPSKKSRQKEPHATSPKHLRQSKLKYLPDDNDEKKHMIPLNTDNNGNTGEHVEGADYHNSNKPVENHERILPGIKSRQKRISDQENASNNKSGDTEETNARRNVRKYSVNKSGVHLGVTRGTRLDNEPSLTPKQVISSFNKNDATESSPVVVVVNHVSSPAEDECFSCSKKSATKHSKRHEMRGQYLSPYKEFDYQKQKNPKQSPKGKFQPCPDPHEKSIAHTKQQDIKVPRSCMSLKSPKSSVQTSHLARSMYQTRSVCTVVAINRDECTVHNSELSLSDLLPNDNVNEREEMNVIETYAASCQKPRNSVSRSVDGHGQNDKDGGSDTLVDFDSNIVTDENYNHISDYTNEQMYFWARKMSHNDHVNTTVLEVMRTFLEKKVSLLKLKAVRAILRDEDLQSDESLTLIIKEILGNEVNVLPLILEQHFMESSQS